MTWDDAPPTPQGSGGHVPVMLGEVVRHLAPAPGKTIIDGTFGGGGYSLALLEAGAAVIAIDRDPEAVARARTLAEARPALRPVEGRFGELDAHARALGCEEAHGVVLDVGVSSYQLDQAQRGFSFRLDGPLDMRMGGEGPSAADIVNNADVSDLAHLIRSFGEERRAGAVARAIVAARPLTTTQALAAACERAVRAAADGIHPATRTFQALRIAVNDELGELARALSAAEHLLRAGGRLVVVAFHSLEDRIVKRFLAERGKAAAPSRHLPLPAALAPSFVPLTGKPLTASEAEIRNNPRARSARLRAAERTAAKAHPGAVTAVPHVRLKGVW